MADADLVGALLAALREDEDGLYFERAALDTARGALARLDDRARKTAAVPLVALAMRVQAEAPGRAGTAVAQLCRVVTTVGVALAEVSEGAKKLLAVTTSSRPVGAERVAGAKSPMDLRLKR